MTVRRAAVIGATGVVGGALAEELVRRGVEVVAISRSGGPVAGATAVAAQADDPGALGAAFAGADVVYHLVHSLGADDFAARDRAAAAGVARAAEAAGVAQIVFLGGLGEPGEDGLSEHLASRAETARVLAAGPVPVTTLRAAMIVAPDSAAFVTIVALVDRLPGMICPRWVSTPTQPIARADAVAYLAGVAGVEETFGETYDIGGPEVMTYRGMIERVARLRGRRPLIVEVPVLTPRLSSLWIRLVTPVNADVARPLVEGMRTPTTVVDRRIERLVRVAPTPFDVAARDAMA